jgi:hypothetical protein
LYFAADLRVFEIRVSGDGDGMAREGNAICVSRDPYSSGVLLDYAQGRLSTPFGWRLAAVRVTAPLITEDSPGGWELTFL